MTLPALNIDLAGAALIEASAGTGKTWTLTAVIVRLLLEGNRPARAIVATTFTRKAAAEMRRRVNGRLQELLAASVEAEAHRATPEDWEAWLERDCDPLARHLFRRFAEDLATLRARCAIAVREMNHMFINTLDALCQRWLAEYALETGSDERFEIGGDREETLHISHDALRAFYWALGQRDLPNLSRYLTDGKPKTEDFVEAIRRVDSFRRAPLERPPTLELPDDQRLQAAQQRLDLLTREEGERFVGWVRAQQAAGALGKSSALANNLAALPLLKERLLQRQLPSKKEDSSADSLLGAIRAPNWAKAASAETRAAFEVLPLVGAVRELAAALQLQKDSNRNIAREALWVSAEQVRDELGPTLERQGRSSHSLNLQRLNDALSPPAGEKLAPLARYLRHRYPVMLVDESQDLNAEQALLLERIYLNDPSPDGHFLLLVGDPKQAIYGFRGGDVASYQQLKRHFRPEQCHALTENRRSSPRLIAALNHHYRDFVANGPQNLGAGIHYQEMQALAGPRPLTDAAGQDLQRPLLWLAVEPRPEEQEDKNAAEIRRVVATVQALLAPTSPYRRHGQPLRPQDLLLLAPRNDWLNRLAAALLEVGISSELQEKNRLFALPLAREMARLLAALLEPNNRLLVNGLLTSAFFGRSLAELDPWDEDVAAALQEGLERWQRFGLLDALHQLCQRFSLWENLAAAPAPQNRLNVLHFRALLEVVADQGPRQQPPAFYSWWLQQLEEPPEKWPAPTLGGGDSVRLLTIHGAKGLQAPVVIVSGLKTGPGRSDGLQIRRYYVGDEIHLSLDPPAAAAEGLKEEEEAEKRRQLYVALTRAEDLLIVCYQKPSETSRSKNALTLLRPAELDAGSGSDLLGALPVAMEPPAPGAAKEALPPLLPLPARREFYGWQRTSFTALTRAGVVTVDEENYADEIDALYPRRAGGELDAIRTAFPRGTEAGSFLHKVLERLQPQEPGQWAYLLKRFARQYKIPLAGPEEEEALRSGAALPLAAVQEWLAAVLAAPLPSGAQLGTIPANRRSPELSFALALDDGRALPVVELNQLFADFGQPLHLPPDGRHYRYLRGEIDLVYEHEGRFYILDYKSNYLGERWDDYRGAALQRAMAEHQYGLQAALYQLALYRRLGGRADLLGGVEYAFVRGLSPARPGCGLFYWAPPVEFLRRLDELLGTH